MAEWTKSDSEKLRKLAEKATPGTCYGDAIDEKVFLDYARTDVPRLLDHVEALEAENEKLKAELYRPSYDEWFKAQNFPPNYLICGCEEILQTHNQNRQHYERGCFGPQKSHWKKQEEEIRRLRNVVEAAKKLCNIRSGYASGEDFKSWESEKALYEAISELEAK